MCRSSQSTFVQERDRLGQPYAGKGIRELGICGAGSSSLTSESTMPAASVCEIFTRKRWTQNPGRVYPDM